MVHHGLSLAALSIEDTFGVELEGRGNVMRADYWPLRYLFQQCHDVLLYLLIGNFEVEIYIIVV